jgi:lipopolysaccharide transport system ATP-binding protein
MSCDSPQAIFVDAVMHDDPSVAIVAANLGKCYDVFSRPVDRLKQALLRRPYGRKFWALREVSFTVRKGEALGIVGHNGAGKSTLLQILAGALRPSVGEARLRGRVASLLELGSGFLPEFTGRENVFVNGTALGLSTKEIGQRLGQIQEFADIGDFFEQPVKTYSSGMFVRLAFAVQACLDPDILIVDEALAVGDVFFQQKCHAHMAELLRKGTAILLVTHDVQAVRKYCSSVILLEKGSVVHQRDVEMALRLYANRGASPGMHERSGQAGAGVSDGACCTHGADDGENVEGPAIDISWPSDASFLPLEDFQILENKHGTLRVERLAICNAAADPCKIFEQNEHAVFYIEASALRDMEQLVVSLTFTSNDNLPYYCKNTIMTASGLPTRLRAGMRVRIEWRVGLAIARGDYVVSWGFAEYPEWTVERSEGLSPEGFSALSSPILTVLNASVFSVCAPSRGLKVPFMGMVDLDTQVKSQSLRAVGNAAV